jgi:hypothetical protein
MKTNLVLMMAVCLTASTWAGEFVVQRMKGDVTVRHGVAEVWSVVSVGDVLRPDDTMKTGMKGEALIVVGGVKRITLPADVIVDMSDIRTLSQEELMLKLTMERVRASSYEWKSNDLNIPNVTVVHGSNRVQSPPVNENDVQVGLLQLNGTKVLFNYGFYSTCALKAMNVLRQYPSLRVQFPNRLLVADALEKAHLRGEALNEYVALSNSDGLTPEQRTIVQARIGLLRKEATQ